MKLTYRLHASEALVEIPMEATGQQSLAPMNVQGPGIWVLPHHTLDMLSAFLHCHDLRLKIHIFRVAGGPLLKVQPEPSMLQASCSKPGKAGPCGAAQRTPCPKQAGVKTPIPRLCGYVIVKISCRTRTASCQVLFQCISWARLCQAACQCFVLNHTQKA